MIVVELIYNLSVLVALSVLSGFLNNRVDRTSLTGKILQGFLFGVTAIIGMAYPFVFTKGIIFDGRSIVISLCALFFGPLSGLIAAIMAIIYRLLLGGAGVLMGGLVITSSFLIGYFFYNYRRKKSDKNITGWQLYLFGIIVQSFMLISVFALPSEQIIKTYQIVSLTILGIYPLVTILIGKILIDQEQNENFISTLKEKEKLYRTTLYSIGDGVITTDETGKVVNMNMIAESLTGWKEKEAAGKSLNEVFSIINEETKLKVENPVEKVLIQGAIVGLANHTLLISKKGNKIPIADSAAPIKNSDGKIIGVVLVFRDQTTEREFNKELKERERKFSTLVSNLPGFIYRCALDKDWTMEYISDGCFDITGYKPEDFINNNAIAFNDLIHKEYQKPIWDKWIQILKDKQTFEYEYPIHTKQNKTRWIWERGRGVYSEDGILLFLEGFITDVTDRKKNEIEVIRQKEKTQNYLDVAEVMLVAINIDQTISMINRKGCEILGYNENELLGKSWFDLCLPDDVRERVKIFFNQIISCQLQPEQYYENNVITKSGDQKIIGWHNNLLKDDDGNIIGTLSSGMDITEQKRLTDELIRAKDKAEEMNRIKSYFFANMSHELRTPFVGIIGFSELLVESLSDPDFKGYAEQILKSAKRLTDTLNKILNVTRLEHEKYQPNFTSVDVNKAITELVSLYSQAARVNNSIIKTNLLFDSHYIKSDKKLLDEILTNLINNAVKFTNNGRIEITSRSIKTDDKDALEIIVSDTGVGIPQNMQEIIWQEFRQASEGYNRTFEGTGLGLTITKKYVDILGGEISLESELGIGTVFTIHLPLDLSDDEKIKMENSSIIQIHETKSNKMKNSKPKLLYVEDDVIASNFIELILKSEFEIDTAVDAKTTLEKVEKNHYDILMLDINLGRGMDGIELLEKIKMIDYYKNIPIIAVTAYAAHSDKTEFLAKGFTHYISKPFFSAELKSLLAGIFN